MIADPFYIQSLRFFSGTAILMERIRRADRLILHAGQDRRRIAACKGGKNGSRRGLN
ncbi:MAG TPA: hypothetical protein VFN77_06765 [Acetobacteraceae bacterium]|nr:hypothetical protein [Acetobacteraceae bacterium]